MVALLFIVLSFLFGSLALKRLYAQAYIGEIFAGGFILGSFVSTPFLFLISYWLGISKGLLATLILLTLAIAFLFLTKKRAPMPRIEFKKFIGLTLFSLFWIVVLLPLFLSHMLEQKADGLYSGGGAWGDIALHSTFTEKFAASDKIDLTSPIYSQEKTAYPFLIDFYAGILLRYGLSIQAALVFSGFMFMFAAVILLYFLAFRIFNSLNVAFLTVFLFLFNGGIGVYYAAKDYLAAKTDLLSFLTTMQVEYAHLAVYNLHWSNLIADYVLPQRAFLAGLPAFALVLLFLYSLWQQKQNSNSLRYLVALIIGLLPMWHTHTFLAALGLLLFFIFIDVLKGTKLTVWILPLALIGMLGLPQIYWQLSQTVTSHFMRIQLGWMAGKENIVIFWLRNMGLEFVLFIFGGAYLLVQKKHAFLKIVFIPLATLFLITNVVIFQPHDYDNMKLMIYSHLAITLVMVFMLIEIWRKSFVGKLLALAIVISLSLTGILSVWRESYTSWQIANNEDLKIGQYVKSHTSPEAIFLTSDSHRHPVTMLAGRSIVMGYRGWLWTHGIDYSATSDDVFAMFSGAANTRLLLDKYKVSYVYIGLAELTDFDANLEYWQSHYPVVFENPSGKIFDVRGPELPRVASGAK